LHDISIQVLKTIIFIWIYLPLFMFFFPCTYEKVKLQSYSKDVWFSTI
jgi:hypothetical protein